VRRLSTIHPIFYHTRIFQKRLSRRLADSLGAQRFARTLAEAPLDHVAMRHQSLLRRRLGSSDPRLQENKIVNLGIAVRTIDGLIVRPGETFSFWQRVGPPTAARGYVAGMQLSRGEVRTGVGGGLCQLANLLFWMTLHTPMDVVERHHHSFDPFPDDHRVLPFGSGASVFYNYVDLRFHNPTEVTFQLKVWITDEHLKGLVRCDREWPYTYHLEERNHRFLERGERNYRENEIWRRTVDRRSGATVDAACLIRNFSEVKYTMAECVR
jgi:vancomycin resistance protein VanW